MSIRITRIIEKNIVGIEEVDFAPGTLTAIEGDNGLGKSSFARGLHALIEGGHDITLLRKGAKSGMSAIEFDNGWKFKKSVRPSGSVLEGWDENNVKIENPTSVIKGLFALKTVNVNSFVQMKPKEKAEYLLGLCNIQLSQEQLASVGVTLGEFELSEMVLEQHGLLALQAVRDAVYGRRHATGVIRDENKKTAAKLSESILPELPDGHAAQLDILMHEQVDAENAGQMQQAQFTAEFEKKRASELAGVMKKAGDLKVQLADQVSAIQALNTTHTGEVAQLAIDHDKVLKELKLEYDRKVEKAIESYNSAKQRVNSDHNVSASWLLGKKAKLDDDLKAMRKDWDSRESQLVAEKSLAMANITNAGREEMSARGAQIIKMKGERDDHIRNTAIRQMRDESLAKAEEQGEIYKSLDGTIGGLDILKMKLSASLPISGLLPDPDHYLTYNGIPLSSVNDAEQLRLAFRAAAIAPGEVPLVFVDGLEKLGPKNFAAFEASALRLGKEQGMQFIYTRVTGDEKLKISTQ